MTNINKEMKDAELGNNQTQDIPEGLYRALIEHSPICTIDILLFDPEKKYTLLGRRTSEPYKGMYYAFGGRLRKNEGFEDAVIRIAKNETSVNMEASSITFGGIINEINTGSRFKDINYHAIDLYFCCIISKATTISLDEQHDEYKWFPVNDPALHPNIKTRIVNSLRALNISCS